jgi:hypothetical protein
MPDNRPWYYEISESRPEGDCVCDEENGWVPRILHAPAPNDEENDLISSVMDSSSPNLQSTLPPLSNEFWNPPPGYIPDCLCYPGTYEPNGDICEMREHAFKPCWLSEDKTTVYIPRPSSWGYQHPFFPSWVTVKGLTKAGADAGLISPTSPHSQYLDVNFKYTNPVEFMSFYLMRTFFGVSRTIETPPIGIPDPTPITWCDTVECTDPNKIWNGQKCVCRLEAGFIEDAQGNCVCPLGTTETIPRELDTIGCLSFDDRFNDLQCLSASDTSASTICAPDWVDGLTACWVAPDRRIVEVKGGIPDVIYQIGLNGNVPLPSGSGHPGAGTSEHRVTSGEITSVEMYFSTTAFGDVLVGYVQEEQIGFCSNVRCPPGQTWDPDIQECKCPYPQTLNPETQTCDCPPTFIKDENGKCICPPGYHIPRPPSPPEYSGMDADFDAPAPKYNGPFCMPEVIDLTACWSQFDKRDITLSAGGVAAAPDRQYTIRFNHDEPSSTDPKYIGSLTNVRYSYKDPIDSVQVHFTDEYHKDVPVALFYFSGKPEEYCNPNDACPGDLVWTGSQCGCPEGLVLGPNFTFECPPGWISGTDGCAPESITALTAAPVCLTTSNTDGACFSGGSPGASYTILFDDGNGVQQHGTVHIGGTFTCVTFPKHLGNSGKSSLRLVGQAGEVNLVVPQGGPSVCGAGQTFARCGGAQNGPYHYTGNALTANSISCACDYGFYKDGADCKVIPFTSEACSINERSVMLTINPGNPNVFDRISQSAPKGDGTFYRVPYKACNGPSDCVTFFPGPRTFLTFRTPISNSLTIQVDRSIRPDTFEHIRDVQGNQGYIYTTADLNPKPPVASTAQITPCQ